MQTKIEITYKPDAKSDNLFLNNLLSAVISQIESSGKTYAINHDSSIFVCLRQHVNPDVIIILKKARAKRKAPSVIEPSVIEIVGREPNPILEDLSFVDGENHD